MATTEKNVSPEERLLNVIRGKDGKDSKGSSGSQSAADSVDEEAPPLDEAPPPAAAPAQPAMSAAPEPKIASQAAKPALTTDPPASAPSPVSEPQTTGPRPKVAMGDERLKAALSKKVSERTRGEDKPGGSAPVREVGGAAATIANLKVAAKPSVASSVSSRPATVAPGETTPFIAKKIQGDTSAGIRYVSMGFAAIILIVVLFSSYEIIAAMNVDVVPKPQEAFAVDSTQVGALEAPMPYQLLIILDSFRKKPIFGRPEITVDSPARTVRWMDVLTKNFVVLGRLGDPANGGELILRDNRDNRQYFISVGKSLVVDDVSISLQSVSHNGILFSDGTSTKELPTL
jgi:hypothetical protein